MDILFRRDQKAHIFGDGVDFKLHAKIELNEEEAAHVKRYNFSGAALIEVEQPGLIRNSILLGLLSFVILTPVIAVNFWRDIGLGWVGVICISAGIAMLAGFFAYHQMRETIYLKDLLHGRYFTCRSVVELARKEAGLESICGYLRQVIESAKHWDGEEKFEILPLPKEEAKRMILSGPLF